MDENDTMRADLAGNPEPPEPSPPAEEPTAVVQPPPVYASPPPPPRSPPAQPYTVAVGQPAGPPGIGIAGFVCVIVGLIVPLVGIVGLILSIVGYRQAKRENRPQGLALAGMIIGIIATALGVIILIAIIAVGAGGSS
jgi:hypothetical protein